MFHKMGMRDLGEVGLMLDHGGGVLWQGECEAVVC